MENPQAQMPQGQPGPAPEQMQQGQPQQGGQDQQMQQIMQFVQQALQQGGQPADVAAQLLQSQVPPEIIMQVFVQMGMPQEEAQRNIEQAMQGGGQQPQGQGEEMMEGQASNPQEEQMEGSEEREEEEEEDDERPQMGFGGLFSHNRRIKNKKNTIVNNYYGYPPNGAGGNNLYGGNYKTNYDNSYTNTTQGQNDFPSLQSAASSNEPPVPYSASDEIDDYKKRVAEEQAALRQGPNNGGNFVKDWTETGGTYMDGFPRFSDGQFGSNGYTPPYGYKNGGGVRQYADGGSVVDQLNQMIANNVDPREIMKQVQAAAQQGAITPEQATAMMETLQGMNTAQDPQANDAAMVEGSQDPQQYDENMTAPEQSMGVSKFGGKIKRNLIKAFGGPAVLPGSDSKDYAKERSAMFVNSVKGDMFKATLGDSFPSLSGNSMAYGGLVKADKGINLKDDKVEIDPSQYKTEDEYLAAIYRWNKDPKNAKAQIGEEQLKGKEWKAPAPTYKEKTNYIYDPATGSFVENPYSQAGVPAGYNPYAATPVGYANINDPYYQLYNQASPFARMLSNLGTNRGMYDPRITGSNLPGGMNAEQFLGAIGGIDKLASGMTGKVGDQTWRIGAGEKFKEGSIWKGNRRKGVRYQIDWGNPTAAPGYNPTAAGPGLSGYNADANGNGVPDYLELASLPARSTNNVASPIINSTTTPYPGYVGQSGLYPAPEGTQMTTDANGNQIAIPTDNTAWQRSSNMTPGGLPLSFSNKDVAPIVKEPLVETPYTNSNISPEGELYTDKSRSDWRNIRKHDDYKENFLQKAADAEAAGVSLDDNNYIPYDNIDRKDYTSDKEYYKAMYPNLPNREIRKMDRRFDNATDPYFDEAKYTSEQLEANDQVAKKQAKEDKEAEREADREARIQKRSDRRNARNVDIEAAIQQAKDTFKSPVIRAYGGNIDPQALQNAIHLINRAFGGMIPQADNGLEVGAGMKPVGFSTDPNSMVWKDPNKTMPSLDNPNPQNQKQGEIEATEGKSNYLKGLEWGQMAGATAQRLTNFANQYHAYDPNRQNAKFSALNDQSNEFDNMSRGIFGQQGEDFTDQKGNQILNPTNSNFSNQQFVALGGRIYELGGEYDMSDEDLSALSAYGIKFRKV